MSKLLDPFKPKPNNGAPRMPRGETVGMTTAPEANLPHRNHVDHDQYSDEAMRVAQRHLDQLAAIESLREESGNWRQKCLSRETEIERLMLERSQLIEDLDAHKAAVAGLKAQFGVVTDVLLKAFKQIDQFAAAHNQAAVDMPALAAAIDEATGVELGPQLKDELAGQAPPTRIA